MEGKTATGVTGDHVTGSIMSLLTRPIGFPLPLFVAAGNLLGDVIVMGVVSLRAGVRFHVTLQVTWRKQRSGFI